MLRSFARLPSRKPKRQPVYANRDVVDIILSSRNDWTTSDYAKLVRVSLAWAEAVYRPLYEDIMLTTSKSCGHLLRTLKARPELAQLVKKLIVSVPDTEVKLKMFTALFHQLQVTELVVDRYIGVIFTSIMFDVPSTNLKQLHIRGHKRATQLHVDTLFKTFQNLEKLTVERVCLAFTDVFPSETGDETEKVWPFHVNIKQAEIIRPDGPGTDPYFRGLWAESMTMQDFNDTMRKMHTARPSIRNLERLVVDITAGGMMEHFPAIETYADPFLPKLTHLSISGLVYPVHFALAARNVFKNLKVASIIDCFRYFMLEETYMLPHTIPPLLSRNRSIVLAVKFEEDFEFLRPVAKAYNLKLALICEQSEEGRICSR